MTAQTGNREEQLEHQVKSLDAGLKQWRDECKQLQRTNEGLANENKDMALEIARLRRALRAKPNEADPVLEGQRCVKCGSTRLSLHYFEGDDDLEIECDRCDHGWVVKPLDARPDLNVPLLQPQYLNENGGPE